MSPRRVRVLALLWMFPGYPFGLLCGWLIGLPLVACLGPAGEGSKMVRDMWKYTREIPRRYARAARELVSGVQP